MKSARRFVAGEIQHESLMERPRSPPLPDPQQGLFFLLLLIFLSNPYFFFFNACRRIHYAADGSYLLRNDPQSKVAFKRRKQRALGPAGTLSDK